MFKRSPYDVIKFRYITEKSNVLEMLKNSESNVCLKKCSSPKYVFVVDRNANKKEIADSVEEIYADSNIKVIKVNTILSKPKKRRVRGRLGFKARVKKAIVTLDDKSDLNEKV